MPQGTQHVDFGATLRQAREQRGTSLRAIADATKISLPALEALERNDISHLPGGIFTRSFVRAYAREVGLDPEDAVRRFIASVPGQEPSAADAAPRMAIREDVRLDQGSGVRRAVGRVLTSPRPSPSSSPTSPGAPRHRGGGRRWRGRRPRRPRRRRSSSAHGRDSGREAGGSARRRVHAGEAGVTPAAPQPPAEAASEAAAPAGDTALVA
jgi:transcriptional regulator with XRE-family HTH domain